MGGNGIQQSQLLNVAGLQTVNGRTGEDAVAGAGVDLVGTAHFHDGLGSVAQRARGIHHVIKEDAVLALHVANDIHDLALVGLLAALVHDSQLHVQLLSEGAGAGHRANVGRDHHHILALVTELLGVIIHKDGVAQQVIHGDVEEALDLGGVEVHGQHTVSTGSGDHVGHQLGRDGIAGLGLAVLTGIAEIGDDGGDTAGRSAAQRVDHHQQLHQVVIDRLAGGLDYEHVAAADGLVQGDGDLAVSEALDLRFTQLGAHHLADLSRQRLVCVTAENFDVLPVRNHRNFPLFSVYFICSKFQNHDSCSIFAKTGSSSAMVSGPKIGSQPDTSEAPDTALVILFFQTSRSSRPGAE